MIIINTAEKQQIRDVDKRYIEMAVEKYGTMLFRLCLTLVKDYDDAEDAVQDTYIKYLTKAPQFNDSEHEKAWLIRVATNICKNMIRFRKRNSSLCLEEIGEIGVSETDSGIFEAIMSLPAKYKLVMDLHYIEGYTASEISAITGTSVGALKASYHLAQEKIRLNLSDSNVSK